MQEMQLQTLDFAAIARTDGQNRSQNTPVPGDILPEHPFASVFGGQGDTAKPEVKQGGGDAAMPGVAMVAGHGQMMQTSAKDVFDGLTVVAGERTTTNDESYELSDTPDDGFAPETIPFDGRQVDKALLVQPFTTTSVEVRFAPQGDDRPNTPLSVTSSEVDNTPSFTKNIELESKEDATQNPADEIADLFLGKAEADFPVEQTGNEVHSAQNGQNGSGSLDFLNHPENQGNTPQATATPSHTSEVSTGEMTGQGRSFDAAAYKNESLKSTVARSKTIHLEPSKDGELKISRNETVLLGMNFASDDAVPDVDQSTISKAVEKPSARSEAAGHANAKPAISSVLLQADTTTEQTSESQSDDILTVKDDKVRLDSDLIGPKVGTEPLKATAGQIGTLPNPSGLEKTTLTPLMSEGVSETASSIEAPKAATETQTFTQQNTLQAKGGTEQSATAHVATQQNDGDAHIGRHSDGAAAEKARQDGDGTDIATRATAILSTSTVAPSALVVSQITPLTHAEAEELKAGVEGISERLGEQAHVLSSADRANEPNSPVSMATKADLPTRVAMQLADAARQLPDRPVEITLSPEELGKVRLSFQLSENGAIHVVIAAERGETLDLLRRNIDSLMTEFQDLGYENSGFSFQSFDQGSQGGDQQKFDSSEGTSAESLSATPPASNPHIQPVRLALDATSGMDLRL
ncbi:MULTISPECIES: flagellar hook-length control protein FliK [Roseobacteraceae]|uniref:Flagellar hook-length control protein n=1 Tax=Celeribacter baekdonensis B30 TaxID=1208323 RepID=K2JWD0_9RHOB|nr:MULTISPECIES: flagellar hook-length control protein FliK [Roseobacteraceae]EKE74599.1 flagellar hook-length control protein [Celeribacter baekdonensis B30]KAB6714635.1 flagellar hook-length control protein FliK [Roseobacter sp. TSBP12]|tara:strand:- start:4005 stop:6086 length:2082 start_codon:yes stop_codon:yes gene_type:complete